MLADNGAQSPNLSAEEIHQGIEQAAHNYFNDCRAKVPAFVSKHFRYPGALHTNRVAFGWDIVRAPLNLFWAPVYALICLLRYTLRKTRRCATFAKLLEKAPSGFSTTVQKNISALVIEELLNRDHDKPVKPYLLTEPSVQEAIVQYQVTRTASADITNTLSCMVLGVFAFKKFTPGGFGIGLVLAALLAENIATRNFIFGETLGEIYYGFFPPQPSPALVTFSLIGVMACLSVIAAFSGIVTDPLQARLGIHQKRLYKMLDALEKDFMETTRGSFRPKDQFVARILDAFDALKSGLI